MKNFNLAIEKGRRYFENEIIDFYFIATEFIFKKEDIISGNYRFEFKSNNILFFNQSLTIDVEDRKVIVEKSHEDPLIESDTDFFICGQLTADLIKPEYEEIECLFFLDDKLLRRQHLHIIDLKNLFLLKEWNSYVEDYEVKTKKNCVVRVHLGTENGTYYEEDYQLKKDQIFNFKNYLDNHQYVAVQCSYDLDYDLEEKHVFKGVKGIYNSNYYNGEEDYIPIFPFSKKYTTTTKTNYLNIDSFKDLMSYYLQNPQDIQKTFEMDSEFIEFYYKQYKTSAIGKLYSRQNAKKYHIESEFCKECDKRSECMQLVPSGLSEIIFKKNLMVESFQNCSINKLIKGKE